jgi:TP901 family phage tail tape measure protein
MAGIRADVNLSVNTANVKRSLDRATNEINKIVNGVSGRQVSFNVNQKSFTQPLGRITQSSNEFSKSLEASNARVIAFGLSVSIINGISDAFKALVVEAVRFEKTMADINAVMGISNERLSEFGEGIFDVAQNTAQSFNVAAEAALEFSRQGLETEEVLRRTNDALILTRLTSLDAADSVSGLTAAINAFGKEGLTTTDIIDKLAAVDVAFAVSSEDLINALQRSGAVAIDAGVELDSLIGIVAALQQTTARGGAVIGNSLKTIFTRIQRPESIRQIEELGIVVRDLSGAILPADKILLNMAKSFDALTQAQQSNVVQFSAGIFQANVFRAALADLSKDQSLQAKATKISGQASGEAASKNQLLNKTLSALTSQAGTGIKELTAILGQMSLSPGIGSALEFINERVEELKNSLGGGEEEGSDFAKGLVKGIGNVLTGPAAIAFGAIFIKMFMNIAKFASSSVKDVLGVVSQKDKIKQMEESILQVLSRNLNIQQSLNNLEGDRVAQEKFMLGIIEAQTSAMKEQQMLARSLAKPLVRGGVDPVMLGASGGMIPEGSKTQERKGAREGGYSAGAIDSMNVPGIGKVVYNKAETVKQFPGMKQPAIMPPKSSRAGGVYQSTFKERHGFDPYASHGFVPNFAIQRGSTLVMDKAKLKLFGTDVSIGKAVGKKYKEIQKHFETNMPISIEAGLEQIITSSDKSKKQITGKESLYNSFSALSAKGIRAIERNFDIRSLGGLKPRGMKQGKLNKAEFTEKKVENFLKREGDYQRTDDPEKHKGLADYPIDLIAYGKSYPSYEVKSGNFNPANIISKSLRMASDRELPNWMQQNKVSGGRELEGRNLKKAETLSRNLDLYDPKQKKSAREEGFDFSQDFADEWGLSQGFVPNFAGRKSSQKPIDIYNQFKAIYKKTGYRPLNIEVPGSSSSKDYQRANALLIDGNITGVKQDENRESFKQEFIRKGWDPDKDNKYKHANIYESRNPAYLNLEKWITRNIFGNTFQKGDVTNYSNEQIGSLMVNSGDYLYDSKGHSLATADSLQRHNIDQVVRGMQKTMGWSLPSSKGVASGSKIVDPSNYSLKKSDDSTFSATGRDIVKEFPGVASGDKRSFLGLKTPKNLKSESKRSDQTKKQTANYFDNFLKSKFSTKVSEHNLVDESTSPDSIVSSSDFRKMNNPPLNAYDWEETIELLTPSILNKQSGAPLDFLNPPGEAKFGPNARRTQPHLTGKSLRYIVGKESFPGWSSKSKRAFEKSGNFDLGNLNLYSMYNKGLVPNFASFMSPLRFDIGGEKSNGKSYVARTAKSGKLFLLDKGLNPFRQYMESQGKPAPIMSQGRVGKRDGYWVNQHESDILEWAKQPNPQILERDINEKKAREESLEHFRQDLKHGTFKPLESGYPLQLGGGELVRYSPVSGFGKNIVDKMGPEYKHISVNAKKIQDYARDNNITKKFNSGPAPDHQKALNTMLRLPKADIEKLDFIRPREKSENEKKLELREASPKTPIKWDVKQDMMTKKKSYGIKASDDTFSHFKKFLKTKGVPQRSVQNIDKALQGKSDSLKGIQRKAVEKSQSKSGNQMFYDAAVQADNFEKSFSIPTKDLYIKDLSGLIKEFNSTVYKEFSGGLVPDYSPVEMNKGYVPNFIGFNVPKKSHRLIESFNKLTEQNKQIPTVNDLMQKGMEKEYAVQQTKEDQLLQKQTMVRVLNMMKNEGVKQLFFGQGGKIFPHQSAGTIPFTIEKIKDVINDTGYKTNLKAEGLVPNYANLIYDKDKIESGLDNQVLKGILSERKRKDLMIGPSGVGKSTLAAQYGEFIKGIEDTEKATSYTILSGAGRTKAGGISSALQEIINSVNQSGGKVSYLSASDQVIDERRKKRVENPVTGDLRSEKQLKGTQFAPKNQSGLTEIIQKASKKFEIINAAEGLVPNFAVTLSDDKYYNQKNVQHGITQLYKKSGGRQKLAPKELEFAAERYISAVQDSGKTYPGGNFNVGGEKFNFNEVSMSLMKHGQFYKPKEGETQNLSEGFAGGYVPNFANPLADAVKRERGAGIPSSRIRIEKSSQLKSPQNPIGLAVTNTRDEPAGLQQGIRRAKSMGIDPKTHGASKGLVPNFARDKSSQVQEGGLMQLFVFQSLLSTANGFLQQFAEDGSEAAKMFSKAGQAASGMASVFLTTKEVGSQLTEGMGIDPGKTIKLRDLFSKSGRRKAKDGTERFTQGLKAAAKDGFSQAGSKGIPQGLKAFSGGIASAGKMLLRFTPMIGSLISLGTAANEVFKLFNDGKGVMSLFESASAKAARNLEKLSESTQALESALGALQSQTENKEKIDELELLGSMRTQKQETELFQLKMKELDIQSKVQKSMSQLFQENVTGTAIASRLSHQFTQSGITVEEQTETLQKLIKVQKQRVVIEEGTKAFGDLIEKRFDSFFEMGDLGGKDAKFLEQAASFRGAQAGMALGGIMAGSEDLDPKERLRILEENIKTVGQFDLDKITESSADEINTILSEQLKGTEEFGGALLAGHIGDIIHTIDNAKDNIKGLTGVEASAATNAIKAFVNQLHKQKDLLEKDGIAQTLAQSTAQVKEEYLKIIRSIKDERKQRLHRQDLENSISATQRKIAESEISLLDEHQAISKSTLIRKESSRKIEEISEKFSTDILKANNTSLGAMQSVSEEFIKTDQLATQFRKGAGITMEDAVNNLKKNVGQNLTSLDLSGIETAIGEALSPADAQELRNSFASVSSRIDDLDDNGKIIYEFMREYGSITEGTVAAAFMAALNQKEIMNLTQKQKNLLTDSVNNLKRANQTAETQRKNALSILKEEETLKLIRAKTVEGAVKLQKRLSGVNIPELSIKSNQGETATLSVLNDVRRGQVKTLMDSRVLDDKAYQLQIEKNRTEAESSVLSLRQLQSQEGILRSTQTQSEDYKNIIRIQQAKFESELSNSYLTKQETVAREDFLKIDSKRYKLVNEQLETEMSNARTTARLNLDKLKLTSITGILQEIAATQIKEELTSAQSSSLIASEKSLQLIKNQEISEQLFRASQLQEKSNQLDELRLAARKASMSQQEFDQKADTEVAIERANAISAARLNIAKLKRLSIQEELNKQVQIELTEEITSAQRSALIASEKAIILSEMGEQGRLLRQANELLESSNKLQELENAIRKANVSERQLRLNTSVDIASGRANAIADTRGAAMRASITGSPEDALAFAQSLKETNKLLGNGTRAFDQLRIKMAELNVSAANLGSDLVDIGIDGARTGLKQLFKDIGSGAKSAKEAWSDFSLGLAEQLLDRVMEHNIDKIIKDLTYAFTGEDGSSDAEKIAGSNSHLTSAMGSLEGVLKHLGGHTKNLQQELQKGIGLNAPSMDSKLSEMAVFDKSIQDLAEKVDELSKAVKLDVSSRKNKSIEQTKDSQDTTDFNPTGDTSRLIKNKTLIQQQTARGRGRAANQVLADAGYSPDAIHTLPSGISKHRDPKLRKLKQAQAESLGNIRHLESKISDSNMTPERREALNKLNIEYDRKTGTDKERQSILEGVEFAFREGIDTTIQSDKQGNINNIEELQKNFKIGTDPKSVPNILTRGMVPEFGEVSYFKGQGDPKSPKNWGEMNITKFMKIKEQSTLEIQNFLGVTENLAKVYKDVAINADAAKDSMANNAKQHDEYSIKLKNEQQNYENTTSAISSTNQELSSFSSVISKTRQNLETFDNKLVTSGNIKPEPVIENPQAVLNQSGGIIQKFAEGGFVKGPAGVDRVPAMLTAGEYVIPKEKVKELVRGGELQHFNNGTSGQGVQPKKSRLEAGMEGVARTVVMSEVSRRIGESINKKQDKPPTFDVKRFERLNLGSDVSLKSGDPRLSGKALATDPVMEDYKEFLLDKAAYNAQKKNEKFNKKLQTLGTILGAATSFMMSEVTGILREPVQKLVQGVSNKTGEVFGKYGDQYTQAKAEAKFRGQNLNYSDFKKSMSAFDKSGNKGFYQGSQGNVFYMSQDNAGDYAAFNMNRLSDIQDMGSAEQAKVLNLYNTTKVRTQAMRQFASNNQLDAKTEILKKANGGSIPAMLTAGEAVIPEPIARRIGYDNLNKMNTTGQIPVVTGKGGIDNVGPVGLSEGDFVIRKSSTEKLLRENPTMMRFAMQNPEGFKRGEQGYYQGGIVGTTPTAPRISTAPQQKTQTSSSPVNRLQPMLDAVQTSTNNASSNTTNNDVTNNINVNVTVDQNGREKVSTETSEGSYEQEQKLAMKIKTKVLEVIREEKRIGGELS